MPSISAEIEILTVKELRDALGQVPDDALVLIEGCDCDGYAGWLEDEGNILGSEEARQFKHFSNYINANTRVVRIGRSVLTPIRGGH